MWKGYEPDVRFDVYLRFEGDCKQDQINLDACAKVVTDKLTSVGADTDALNEDKLILETSAAYAWIWPIGTAIALGIDINYGIDMADMENKISALNTALASENKDIADDRAIQAELGNVSTDLNSLIEIIRPAIIATEDMKSSWDAISNDLQAIGTYTDADIRKASGTFTVLVGNTIIHKWTNLATEVDAYRKVAYRTDMAPETTLAQYEADLKAKLAKS
ncbi:hypothetical protein K438DRAFT_1992952 [Mycena galopus ATCC 62051]|nr:hypothetical protein K438DRAFT_1992952 [Mycena galopus ATCC 62051]